MGVKFSNKNTGINILKRFEKFKIFANIATPSYNENIVEIFI